MQSFNMDFILRDSMPRSTVEIIDAKQNLTPENMIIEEKEETMLPDSSLSPSNQSLIGFTMDDSKFSDTEFMTKTTDKKEIETDFSLYNKKFKLVIDNNGDEYWVFETHLVPFVEVCMPESDKSIHKYNTTITTTTSTSTATSHCVITSKGHLDHRSHTLDSFLQASHLALMEVQLIDLERELLTLDEYSFSRFINSGSNLKNIPGQTFLPHLVPDSGASTCIASDSEINERDDARRIRLRQIIRKHSELKKWLSKIKKRLKEKSPSKLCRHIDYSSKERRTEANRPSLLQSEIAGEVSSVSRSLVPDTNVNNIRQQEVDLHGDIAKEDRVLDIDPPATKSPKEITPMKYSMFEKNIFSTMLSLSKDSGDRDGIPLLTYEYDNYKINKRTCEDPSVLCNDGDGGFHNQDPPTPDLRRPELDCNDISEAIRVLVVQTGHLRAGVIHLANQEDGDNHQKLWRVTLDGDRKGLDILLSEWQLLEQGVREVIPTSFSHLAPGARVCANWSEQLPMNLYPGTVTVSLVDSLTVVNKVSINFDDGDRKDVDLDQVRLLPENFPNLHELMKVPKMADSNFYSLDRSNAIRTKRTVALRNSETGGLCYKESKIEKETTVNIRKRIMKKVDSRKKMVVHWKLIREAVSGETNVHYGLARNIDHVRVDPGDSVQLLSYSRRQNYLTSVVSVLARRQSAVMDIKCTWYYILADVQDQSPIIRRLKRSPISKKVIFKSDHSDIHDVYSVLRKVEVLPWEEYRVKYLCGGEEAPEDSYVVAGRYNQVKTKVECLDDDIRHYLVMDGS